MDLFKEDISYLSVLLDFIRYNRHSLVKTEPERIKERLSDYAAETGEQNSERLAKTILLKPYLERFNILNLIHSKTAHKSDTLDEGLINVIKNRLIYNLTKQAEENKPKEKQAWLFGLLNPKKEEPKNELNILFLNPSIGFSLYSFAFEMEYIIPPGWTFKITCVDPLEENIKMSQAGVYQWSIFPPDYYHKEKFARTPDGHKVNEEHKLRLKFEKFDFLTEEPDLFFEKTGEKFDLVIAGEARNFYSVPVLFHILERIVPKIKLGGYLYTGIENMSEMRHLEGTDILSIDNVNFYQKNKEGFTPVSYPPFKEEDEVCSNLLTSAYTCYLENRLDDALQFTYHILNKEVDNRKGILLRCLALIEKGSFRLARNLIRQARILNAMDFDADMLNAMLSMRAGDLQQARKDLHDSLAHFNFNKIYKVISCQSDEEKVFFSRWERLSNILDEKDREAKDIGALKVISEEKTITIMDDRYGEIKTDFESSVGREYLMGAAKPANEKDSHTSIPEPLNSAAEINIFETQKEEIKIIIHEANEIKVSELPQIQLEKTTEASPEAETSKLDKEAARPAPAQDKKAHPSTHSHPARRDEWRKGKAGSFRVESFSDFESDPYKKSMEVEIGELSASDRTSEGRKPDERKF